MNWNRITFFAFGPAVLAFTAGIAADVYIRSAFGSDAGVYAFAAGTLAAVVLYAIPLFRLRRWETDGDCHCERCSGPLSWIEHEGRRWYGRDLPNFHRCWNCGKANGID